MRMMVILGLLGGLGLAIGLSLLLQAQGSGARVWGAIVFGLGVGLIVRAFLARSE